MWHLCEQLNKLKLQFLLDPLVFLTVLRHAGIDSPEDLSILHSNRAACYLKDGNSQDCIQDCTKYGSFDPPHVFRSNKSSFDISCSFTFNCEFIGSDRSDKQLFSL